MSNVLSYPSASTQFSNPYLPVPHGPAVILQADVALAGKVFQRPGEFVAGAIGVLPGLDPPVEVHLVDPLAIQLNDEFGSVASDAHGLPLVGRPRRVLEWGL